MGDLAGIPLSELRARYASGEAPVTPALLRKLRRDPRRGVRALHDQLRRRFERAREEQLRLDALRNFERVLWKQGVRRIAGVDEAGTGPLAGPVVAAAVVFPPEADAAELARIDDSKKLDRETRELLAEAIHEHAAGIGIAEASVEEIDRLNVYQAALLAMRRAVEALPEPPEHVLVDARTVPGIAIPQNPFDKGDGINFSIAAASILAKTHRDALMRELDAAHPGYGLAKHKGYATAAHQRAVRELGPSPVHRRSFTFIRELCGEYSALFYELQRELDIARDRERLAAFETRLKQVRETLAEVEYKKLKLVASRRWKLL